MTVIQGSKVKARYLADASQVVIDTDYYDIVAETDSYIALFKPGRSIYISGRGSEYEPARMYFCAIRVYDDVQSREKWVELVILLDTPIRRR